MTAKVGWVAMGLAALMVGAAALVIAVSVSRSLPALQTVLLNTYNALLLREAREKIESEKTEPSFALVQLGTFRRDQFLVDRNTGRVWQNVCSLLTKEQEKQFKKDKTDCPGMNTWAEMYAEGISPPTSFAHFRYAQSFQEEADEQKGARLTNPTGTPSPGVSQRGMTLDEALATIPAQASSPPGATPHGP